jgi:hypothetical protein
MRLDHTGAQYGSATVLGKDEEQPRYWRIRWGCCGREQVVSVERIGGLRRTLPARCRPCTRPGDAERSEAALRAFESRGNRKEPARLVVITPNGWWPELGPMGPR